MVEVPVVRVRAGDLVQDRDRLVVELPPEIRFGPRSTTVPLRTPGHDEELVSGFLYTEGIIRRAADIVALERLSGDPVSDDAGSVIAVQLDRDCALPGQRMFAATSGCGACGKESLEALEVRAPAIVSTHTIAYDVLETLPIASVPRSQPSP